MNDKELKLIKKAILNEVEGYQFYRMAAKDSVNEETSRTFMLLADEEEKHVEWLNDLLKHLAKDPETRFDLAHLPEVPSPEIFRWDNLQEEDANRALSVFSIGMQMERASFEFYEKGIEETDNEDLKQLFDILAKWERAHYDQFREEYEKLEQDFWAEQQFAPF